MPTPAPAPPATPSAPRQEGLTERQAAFVEHLTTPGTPAFGNRYRAALAAGYAKETARAQGTRLSDNVGVRRAIDARMAALALTHEQARAMIAEIAAFDASAFVVFEEVAVTVDRPMPVHEAARRARAEHQRAEAAERRAPRVSADQIKARVERLAELEMRAVELELHAEDEPDAVVAYPAVETRRLPRLDLDAAERAGVLHLVRGLRYDPQGRLVPDLPDRLDALKHVDKMHTLGAAKGMGTAAADGLDAALAAMGVPVVAAQTVNIQINHTPPSE